MPIGVGAKTRSSTFLCFDPSELVPFCETLDGGVHLRRRFELVKPLLEHGQLTVVLGGKHPVVSQDRSQVLNFRILRQSFERFA